MPILFKERDIVVPGEVIAQGNYKAGDGTFRDNDKIKRRTVGLNYPLDDGDVLQLSHR